MQGSGEFFFKCYAKYTFTIQSAVFVGILLTKILVLTLVVSLRWIIIKNPWYPSHTGKQVRLHYKSQL